MHTETQKNQGNRRPPRSLKSIKSGQVSINSKVKQISGKLYDKIIEKVKKFEFQEE